MNDKISNAKTSAPKALITGASAGLGASFARALAARGYDLVLLARRRDRLQALADKLTAQHAIRCEVMTADLSGIEEIRKTADHIRRMDNLDLLINNAGFASLGYFADIPSEKSMRMFHLHMTAPVELTHAALQGMLPRKHGTVINVSSLAAFVFTPGNVMYDSTKAFLAAFSKNLMLEVKEAGIKIQCLCPGFTRTEFHEVGDFKNFDRSVIPKALWMSPDEVVSLSLDALEHSNNPIFIPGWKNRLVVWLYLHSSMVRSRMQQNVEERRPNVNN